MPTRLTRIAIAHDTLNILEQGFYTGPSGEKIDISREIDFAKQHSVLYPADRFDPVFKERNKILAEKERVKTVFEVTAESTLEAAQRLSADGNKVFCLNFASAKNPGGGFLNGSQAQEESIARSSAMYPCIEQMRDMYNGNRRLSTCLYSDDMIYSPAVPVFRTDEGDLLDQFYSVSILTAPAVNAGVIRDQERDKIARIDEVMNLRLEKLLSVAVVRQYQTLLLGAWGCGVFRNDPVAVAGYFRQQLLGEGLFAGVFERVVFAIYGSEKGNVNLPPFREVFV